MISSNATGPSGGCVSPANTSALLVTKANVQSLGGMYMDISEGSGSHAATYFPLDKNIRVLGSSGYGVLTTMGQIQAEAGVANPSSGTGVLASLGSTPGVKIKRPNCECTMLNSFRVWNYAADVNGSMTPTYMNTYTFEDGYSISLGFGWSFLRVHNGININNGTQMSAGTYVASCMSNGNTTDISSGCVKITSKVQFDISAGTIGASHFTTNYPRDSFPSSEIAAAVMLENGVYVFLIPHGATY